MDEAMTDYRTPAERSADAREDHALAQAQPHRAEGTGSPIAAYRRGAPSATAVAAHREALGGGRADMFRRLYWDRRANALQRRRADPAFATLPAPEQEYINQSIRTARQEFAAAGRDNNIAPAGTVATHQGRLPPSPDRANREALLGRLYFGLNNSDPRDPREPEREPGRQEARAAQERRDYAACDVILRYIHTDDYTVVDAAGTRVATWNLRGSWWRAQTMAAWMRLFEVDILHVREHGLLQPLRRRTARARLARNNIGSVWTPGGAILASFRTTTDLIAHLEVLKTINTMWS
jgi:hypothetical protein